MSSGHCKLSEESNYSLQKAWWHVSNEKSSNFQYLSGLAKSLIAIDITDYSTSC